MMKKIYCNKEDGGCGCQFEVNEKNIDKKLKWMECPFCHYHLLNPLYEKDEKENNI